MHRASLTVEGQTLSGDFVVEQITEASGQKVVSVAAQNVAFHLGNGTVNFINATNGQGAFVISSLGIAGTCQVSAAFSIPGISINGGTIRIEVNNTTEPVDRTFVIGGSPVIHLALPSGPFFRVTVIGAQVQLGDASGPVLAGDFMFEQGTRSNSTKLVKATAANVSVTYQGQGIVEGDGAFVILPEDVSVPAPAALPERYREKRLWRQAVFPLEAVSV